jgi:hypothetical protein
MTDEELKQIARRDKSVEIDGIVPKLGYDRGRESKLLPLPPNRTGGSPAYGSPVGGFTG